MKKSQLRLKQTMLFKMGIRFMGLQMLFIGRLRIVNTKPNDLRDAALSWTDFEINRNYLESG